MLATLVDKSLLRPEADDRYTMHALLRQYAGERLGQSSPEEVTSVREKHGTYYLSFLAERNAKIAGGQQIEAAAEIAADFDNVRAARQWAVARAKVDALAGAAYALYQFCHFGSRYLEGARLFAPSAGRLDPDTLSTQPRVTLLLTCLGWFQLRLGRFREAEAVFARAHAVYRRLGRMPAMPYAFAPSPGPALLVYMRGEYGRAKEPLVKTRRCSRCSIPLTPRASYITVGSRYGWTGWTTRLSTPSLSAPGPARLRRRSCLSGTTAAP